MKDKESQHPKVYYRRKAPLTSDSAGYYVGDVWCIKKDPSLDLFAADNIRRVWILSKKTKGEAIWLSTNYEEKEQNNGK